MSYKFSDGARCYFAGLLDARSKIEIDRCFQTPRGHLRKHVIEQQLTQTLQDLQQPWHKYFQLKYSAYLGNVLFQKKFRGLGVRPQE